ncbi:TELO2-interacting protein 2-like [Leptopilina heterotoma]|uniref:TELO2-interacting protein 2-like n=1 Tax=Leptopilina heterotoma TaxID=63436 RepID=UPI001CA8E76D|nr:TELO2-interacting protein 2-like [Leptopilina heterotoma]XP_043482347.1 TELO2-interacting protein 2-like [Leptopilina heterotoma]
MDFDSNDSYWSSCIRLIEKTFVPRIQEGKNRPCTEDDFKNHRSTVNQNCQDILSILQHILDERNETSMSLNSSKVKIFKSYCIIMIGENSQKNLWTTIESQEICKQISEILCDLYSCENLSQLIEQNQDDVSRILTTLRPKLLKDTWKTYPASIICYKWFVTLLKKSQVINHFNDIIPTALIILDDFEVENKVLGLECISEIVQHCHTEKQFVESGFAEMILFNLKKFIYEREMNCTLVLYNCIEKILKSLELGKENFNKFEWSERDKILEELLDKMACEDNGKIRENYMSVLVELLNSLGSFKWCGRVIRIIDRYCEHYGDLNSLKITLDSTKIILGRFEKRISAHSESLFTIFLKLYINLNEIQASEEIFQSLEDCLYLVCQSSPEMIKELMQDDRIELKFRTDFVKRIFELDS